MLPFKAQIRCNTANLKTGEKTENLRRHKYVTCLLDLILLGSSSAESQVSSGLHVMHVNTYQYNACIHMYTLLYFTQ